MSQADQILAAFGMRAPSKPLLGSLRDAPKPSANEAHWRARLANQGNLQAPTKTLGTVLQNAIASGLVKAGVSDRAANHFSDRAFGALNDLTPVGNAVGADEAARQVYSGVTKGDVAKVALGAGMFGLSVLPGAVGKAAKEGGGNILRQLLADEAGAIRAWHGSPHDFDAFDAAKIGTGEGNQAYGDGLYFADKRGVAASYQVPKNEPLPVPAHIRDALHAPLKAEGYLGYDSFGEAVNAVRQDPRLLDWGVEDPANVERIKTALGAYDGARWPKGTRPTLYEVNIDAEPHQFMDLPRGTAAPRPEVAKQQGYVGFKYQDGTIDPKHNYVLFDPTLANILGKY